VDALQFPLQFLRAGLTQAGMNILDDPVIKAAPKGFGELAMQW